MSIKNRALASVLGAAAAPAAVCSALLLGGATPGYTAAGAALAAAAAGWIAWRELARGLACPASFLAAAVKDYVAADYRLGKVMPKQGWPELAGLFSGLNRLLLELSAYRGFHLNKVVEERSKAQALIETITDGVLLTDDKGRLIYSNRRALGLLGIVGTDPEICMPGSVRRREFAGVIADVMTSCCEPSNTEVALPGPGGEDSPSRTFLLQARPFTLATMPAPGRIIVLRDVTMEKEMETARDTLFHMITHDMRAPLASILGYSQILGKKLDSAEPVVQRSLEIITRSSRRLNGMVEDILNTMKLERGGLDLKAVPVSGPSLCASVLETYGPLAADKKISLRADAPDRDLQLEGDPVLLERVLANLTGNALKFTPSGGAVTLSCRRKDGEALFRVADTGPGIPAESQKRIFEKYAQLDEHKFMGFGLGLAMCKMAVELHRGRIWVESVPGSGSRFLFTVPLKQEAR